MPPSSLLPTFKLIIYTFFYSLHFLYLTVEIFSGSCNPITLSRRYKMRFNCEFDLLLYPFDYQTCQVPLLFHTTIRNYVKFLYSQSIATFTGPSKLREYEVCSSSSSSSRRNVPYPLLCWFHPFAFFNVAQQTPNPTRIKWLKARCYMMLNFWSFTSFWLEQSKHGFVQCLKN